MVPLVRRVRRPDPRGMRARQELTALGFPPVWVKDEVLTPVPAMMDMTAMRTAMPNVTCDRITECAPSATQESISMPRFIGPGCITIASGRARASFSSVRP